MNTRLSIRIIFVLCFLSLACIPIAHADRGAYPFTPSASIYRPQQWAIIAWNENEGEEILILSSNVFASEPTRILEVIAFPSQPIITKVDRGIFRKIDDIVTKKSQSIHSATQSSQSTPDAAVPKVSLYPFIPAEKMEINQFLSSTALFRWIERFFQKEGYFTISLSEGFKKLLWLCLKDQFPWFAFNTANVTNQMRSMEPVQYRFKTSFMYYPLRLGRTLEGTTSILLFILAPHSFNEFSGFPIEKIDVLRQFIPLSTLEMNSLSKEFQDFFGERKDIMVNVWQINGSASTLDKDVLALGYATSEIENVGAAEIEETTENANGPGSLPDIPAGNADLQE